jgi:hypothetical protein
LPGSPRRYPQPASEHRRPGHRGNRATCRSAPMPPSSLADGGSDPLASCPPPRRLPPRDGIELNR